MPGGDFYRGFDSNGIRRGLTIPHGYVGPSGTSRQPTYTAGGFGGAQRAGIVANLARAYKYPGIMTPERGARGSIPTPLQAAISNNSTITLTDGINTRLFEFVNDGTGLTLGDVLVDIQGLVTELEVATAFAAAIVADFPNIVLDARVRTTATGARVAIAQQVPVPFPGWWQRANMGQTGFASLGITPSVPAEWPGIPTALRGGRGTLSGVAGMMFLQAGPIRAGGVGPFYEGVKPLGASPPVI